MQKITKYAIFNYNEVDSDLIDLLSKSLEYNQHKRRI